MSKQVKLKEIIHIVAEIVTSTALQVELFKKLYR